MRPFPRTAGRGLIVAALVSAVLLTAITACTVTPTIRREERSALPTTLKTVADQVSITGPRGRLNSQERKRLIQSLGQQGHSSLLQRHLAGMAAFGEVDLSSGNQAKLLIDGPATFEAMFSAIEMARSSILLESYIIDDAVIAQKLAQLLARKRAEGLTVAVLYDAVGSIGTAEDFFDGLRKSGIAVCAFNPFKPTKRPGYFDITHRDHRKILAIDREWGFTGGINISAVYSSGSFRQRRITAEQEIQRKEGWRDTQVRVRGHAAASLDDLVRETWVQQRCEGDLPAAQVNSTPTQAFGPDVIRIIPVTPEDRVNRIYALLLTAIDASQRSVYLTMAYFAPGPDMIDALCDAAKRGVDVQLVLPSVSDFSPVLYAGQSYYQRMLEAGVKIHELQTAVLHSKTAVIDGVVSTVGSSNMDWRSFAANNEVNAVIMGEDFGNTMITMFKRDVAVSKPISIEAWRTRSLWQRIKEAASRAFEAVF